MAGRTNITYAPHPQFADRTVVDVDRVPERSRLGTLCHKGHDYRGSGKSLRYVVPENCVICTLEYTAEWRAERKAFRESLKPEVPEGHRFCNSCRQSPSISEFPITKGMRFRCKKCWIAYKNAYYAAHPDVVAKQKQTALERRRNHDWMGRLVNGSTSSARRAGREHNIGVQDVIVLWERQGGLCYWFGVPMVPSKIPRHPFIPSLDRLDCSRGYTRDNVVLACLMANYGRTNTPADEFADVVRTLKLHMRTAS